MIKTPETDSPRPHESLQRLATNNTSDWHGLNTSMIMAQLGCEHKAKGSTRDRENELNASPLEACRT